jgi:hypothetical protein
LITTKRTIHTAYVASDARDVRLGQMICQLCGKQLGQSHITLSAPLLLLSGCQASTASSSSSPGLDMGSLTKHCLASHLHGRTLHVILLLPQK